MSETIGEAYIQIRPSFQGVDDEIAQGLSGAANKAGNSVGSSFGSALSKGAKVAGAAIAASATAIGAFGKKAVDAGAEFDVAMSQVGATLGYSVEEINNKSTEAGKNFEKLRDFAQEMGRTTAWSATESAEALNYMALAGYDADLSIEMLPTVLDLASAGSMDLARASDMVTDAQSALGLSVEETKDMVDMMAKTASSSNTSVEQLGDAFLKVGPTARDVSGGIQEMSAVLGTLANSGIKGTEAGTHLRNMLLAMNPQTDKAVAAWDRLSMSAYDANGELRPLNDTFEEMAQKMAGMSTQERTEMISAMFNKTDLASINTMLAATIGNADEVSLAFEEAGLAFDDFVNKDFTNSLSQAMADAFFALKNGTLNSKEGIDEFQQSLERAGFTAEQASTFMDTFLATASAGANDFDVLNGKIKDFDGSAEKMANVQLDNLTGDVTLFKSALEGAQITIADQLNPTLREFVQFGTDSISNLTSAFKNGGIEGLFSELGTVLSGAVGMITEHLPQLTQAALGLIQSLLEGLIPLLPQMLPPLIEMVVGLVELIAQELPTILEALLSAINAALPTLMEAIPSLIESIVAAIVTALPILISGIVTLIEGLAQNLPELIVAIINILPDLISQIVVAIVQCMPQIIEGLVMLTIGIAEHTPEIIAALVMAIPQIIASLMQEFEKGAPQFVENGKMMISKIGEGVTNLIPNLLNNFANLIMQCVSKIREKTEDFRKVGRYLIEGLWNGISGTTSWLIGKIKGFCSSALGAIKDFFSIGSPSKLMADEVGRWLPPGIAVGIEANADSAIDAMDNLGTDMTTSLVGNVSGISTDYSGQTTTESVNGSEGGLFELLSTYLPIIAQGQNITLEGDAGAMFRAIRGQNDIYKNANGKSAFA